MPKDAGNRLGNVGKCWEILKTSVDCLGNLMKCVGCFRKAYRNLGESDLLGTSNEGDVSRNKTVTSPLDKLGFDGT